MKILIKAVPLGQGRVTVLTLNAETLEPVESVYTGTYRQALRERNHRFARWCHTAVSVRMEKYPEHF